MALANSLTLADLEAMPDDGRRYELIGGAIVMTPAPGPKHQLVSARLLRLLEDALPDGHAVLAASPPWATAPPDSDKRWR